MDVIKIDWPDQLGYFDINDDRKLFLLYKPTEEKQPLLYASFCKSPQGPETVMFYHVFKVNDVGVVRNTFTANSETAVATLGVIMANVAAPENLSVPHYARPLPPATKAEAALGSLLEALGAGGNNEFFACQKCGNTDSFTSSTLVREYNTIDKFDEYRDCYETDIIERSDETFCNANNGRCSESVGTVTLWESS